jgi:hypothetical protein
MWEEAHEATPLGIADHWFGDRRGLRPLGTPCASVTQLSPSARNRALP